VLDGRVPVAKVAYYPHSGEIPPYASGAPWNPDFPRKFVQATSSWLHSQMNFNSRSTFTNYVYTYFGVLRGWITEAYVLGITEHDALQAFLLVKLNEKFAEVRPTLEIAYPGLTENKYRVLMSMNLSSGHFRFAPGRVVRSLFDLLAVNDGNCAHLARTVQELTIIQGMTPRHIALLENFGTPYGQFSTGHNLTMVEGMIVDAEINVAFDIGTSGAFWNISGPSRLPRLFVDHKVYGFYNWLNSPPVRAEQLARGEDGGAIAYYYWFYLWGLDSGSTRIITVQAMPR
jgi:hypothetical protein